MEIPKRMRDLPVTNAGYVVPWFVWFDEDDVPDFRVVAPGKIERALRDKKCWLCGKKRSGATDTFVIGPMCAVNRVSAEPPSHYECARYAAMVCPFLSNPKKRRRENNTPPHHHLPGDMIERNPGVALLWIGRHWKPFAMGKGVLINVGPPTRVEWYCEGREATREEVMRAIETGLPILQRSATQQGEDAEAQLVRQVNSALELVPA